MVKEMLKTDAQKDTANFALQLLVAIVVLALAISTLFVMVFAHRELKDNTNFSMWLGAIIGWIGALLAFCFPNSIGSQKQADTIAKLADKTPPPTGEALEAAKELADALPELPPSQRPETGVGP